MLTQKMERQQIEIDSSRTRGGVLVQTNAPSTTDAPLFIAPHLLYFFILTSGYLICGGATLV